MFNEIYIYWSKLVYYLYISYSTCLSSLTRYFVRNYGIRIALWYEGEQYECITNQGDWWK